MSKDISNTLFDKETIARLISDVPLTSTQKKSAREWKQKLDEGKIGGETNFSSEFSHTILINVLGYSFNTGLQQDANRMDYSYTPKSGKNGIVFELKSLGKHLEHDQHRANLRQLTPIDQTLSYIIDNKNIEYGLCTNYQRFQLVTRQEGKEQCYIFDFPKKGETLTDEQIKEFVTVFSKERIDSGFVEKLRKDSENAEQKIEEDFYKLFHQTRLMLVESFKEKLTPIEAVRSAQTYLNRLIFIFFAEDNDLIRPRLFIDEIKEILESDVIREKTTKISDQIQTIFSWMNSGSREIKNTLGFNGELFKDEIDRNAFFVDLPDKNLQKKFKEIKKKVVLAEKDLLKGDLKNAVRKYSGNLNPIVENLLLMDLCNFKDEINVNILGHIFENSIGDLEILRGEKTTQQKEDGVFYTQPYVTDYICRNTIVPYLSKTGTNKISKLIDEYENDIETLEKQVREIKILDPSCGSGAFLIKAVDILLEIQNEINNYKIGLGQFKVPKKGKKAGATFDSTLDPALELRRTMEIIHDNIYGVDINPESIEITKLSLFLKIASKDRRLFSLSRRILEGNSLVNDVTLATNYFHWETKFSEIFPDQQQQQIFKDQHHDTSLEKGFDIVIGNPPYLNIRDFKMSQDVKDHITDRFGNSTEGQWDLFVPFVHLGLDLLKEGGNLSMIIKDTIGVSSYTKKLVEFIESNYFLYQIDFFPKIKLFKNAEVFNKIIFIKKIKSQKQTKRILHNPTKVDLKILESSEGWKKYNEESAKFNIDKIRTVPLGNICYCSYGLRPNSDKNDSIPQFKKLDLLSETKTDRCNRKYTEGKFLEPYSIVKELFIEWDSKRCPDRCYRSTFRELYEPEKLLMSRQKRIVAYSDEKHICDTTIVAGIRFCELKGIENRNIQKYFTNIKKDRQELEEISLKFDLHYILGILNSNLIKYYLHYNSVGKIDSTPDDWKQVPIKDILKIDQELFIQIVNSLINHYAEFNTKKNRLTDKIFHELGINPSEKFDLLTSSENEFVTEIRKTKISLTPKIELEWQEVFADSKKTLSSLHGDILKMETSLNDMVYSLYGVSDKDRSIIESDLAHN